MKKVICILLLVGVCFSLVACVQINKVDGQTNTENYGEIQCKVFSETHTSSLERYMNSWINENPGVVIENIVYGNSGDYVISHYIVVFYKIPIDK